MMSRIVSGPIVDSVKKFLQDKFQKLVNSIKYEMQDTDDPFTKKLTSKEGHEFSITIQPNSSNDQLLDITLKFTNPPNVERKLESIDPKKLEEVLDKELKNIRVKSTPAEDTDASSCMKVSLHKIVSSTSCDIYLDSVTANYEPSRVLANIDSMLDSSAFLNSLSSDPISFDVSDTGSDLEVQVCDDFECDPAEGLQCIFTLACSLLLASRFSIWNNPDVMNTPEAEVSWIVEDLCREVLSVSKELGTCIHPCSSIDTSVPEIVMSLIDAMKLYYNNYSHDIQAMFDMYIRKLSSLYYSRMR